VDEASPGRGGETPAVGASPAELLERDDLARVVFFGTERG
jgi:hypothetical protein